MIRVTMYSKPECHLCDRAKETLGEIRKRHPFELKEVKMLDGNPLLVEYGERVPVIVVENGKTFHFRVPEKEFTQHLQQLDRTNA